MSEILGLGTADEAAIKRNLSRWNAEQEKKRKKQEKREEEARHALKARLDREPKRSELLGEMRKQAEARKAKWRLANCKATIAEVIALHAKKETK